MAQNTICIPKGKNGNILREDWTKARLKYSRKKKSNADALSQMHATSVSKDWDNPISGTSHTSLSLITSTPYRLLALWKMCHCLGISTSCGLKMLPRLLQNIIKMCYIPLWCGIFLMMQIFVAFFYVNSFNSVTLWCFACLKHLCVLTRRWKVSTLSGKEMRIWKAERRDVRRNLGEKYEGETKDRIPGTSYPGT